MTERALGLALRCLEPVQDHLVVVGGTAHRLFPLHELGSSPGFQLLTTEDVDWALPLELGHDSTHSLLDRLRESGFEEEMSGADEPFFTYRLVTTPNLSLQFIAPRTGSGLDRRGNRDRLLHFSGITAEKLPHVDVLLHGPWLASVPDGDEVLRVRVVNPVAYLLQKLLILDRRRDKQAKDLLYIHDTLAVFAGSLSSVEAIAADLAPNLPRGSLRKVRTVARELCFAESAVARDAAHMAANQRHRAPTSDEIVAACRVGLRQVLARVAPDL